jgi:hypothetical protein
VSVSPVIRPPSIRNPLSSAPSNIFIDALEKLGFWKTIPVRLDFDRVDVRVSKYFRGTALTGGMGVRTSSFIRLKERSMVLFPIRRADMQ